MKYEEKFAGSDGWRGIVRWCNLDVIGAAKSNGIDMTEEEAEAWWAENESSLISLLTEYGNEALVAMTSGPAPQGPLGVARDLNKVTEGEPMQGEVTLAETPLGALVGHRATDPEHPGIYIDLHREGESVDAPVLLVEVANDEADLKQGDFLITRVWDAVDEESYQTRVVHTGIDAYFANKEEK